MEQKEGSNISPDKGENRSTADEYEELLQTLEQQTNWDGRGLIKYQGFWCPVRVLQPILSYQKHFRSKDTDIILATMPKSGTTWLKALTFSIINRNAYTAAQSPLLTSNPHELVPFLEFKLYFDEENPDLESIPCPRIFSTHAPYKILPKSALESECKIIYICRNPLDQFISHRHFLLESKFEKDAIPLETDEAFNMFCQGIHPFGPFWEHMLQYWNAHQQNPHKVMFLTYEGMKEDITFCIREIAKFLGHPFSVEEEKQGMVEQISNLCSFEKLSNLEVNKNGKIEVKKNGKSTLLKNKSFFRKGEVGDWTNYLTLAMAERVKKIMETKIEGSGLKFKI